MKELKEILNKLDEGKLIGSSSKKEITIEIPIGIIKVVYRVKEQASFHPTAFQAILTIINNSQVVYSWGCCDNQENQELVNWFIKKNVDAIKADYRKRDKEESLFKQWLKEFRDDEPYIAKQMEVWNITYKGIKYEVHVDATEERMIEQVFSEKGGRLTSYDNQPIIDALDLKIKKIDHI